MGVHAATPQFEEVWLLWEDGVMKVRHAGIGLHGISMTMRHIYMRHGIPSHIFGCAF